MLSELKVAWQSSHPLPPVERLQVVAETTWALPFARVRSPFVYEDPTDGRYYKRFDIVNRILARHDIGAVATHATTAQMNQCKHASIEP